MSYPIQDKLVIGVASSALFDLSDSNQVFEQEGVAAYRKYQQKHLNKRLPKGVAFPFIRRFLSINQVFPELQPVEVVLLSRNSPETGLRVFRSIEHYGLEITRAAFLGGGSPHEFIDAFNASLFLSANQADVEQAIANGFPAGLVLPGTVEDNEQDLELRVAFDFDGVIADDESEAVYKTNDLATFQAHELKKQDIPHSPGPLANLFRKLSHLQQLERELPALQQEQGKILRVSIVTARGAPAHERVLTTLRDWGVETDEAFFLGGMEKLRVLDVLKPHIFFDDQLSHLQAGQSGIPMVHIPFGIANHQKNPATEPATAEPSLQTTET